jgi:hypothetical protein
LIWVDRITRQRPGLRQPPAALFTAGLATQKRQGLPQSKTSRNYSDRLLNSRYCFIETDLISIIPFGTFCSWQLFPLKSGGTFFGA